MIGHFVKKKSISKNTTTLDHLKCLKQKKKQIFLLECDSIS